MDRVHLVATHEDGSKTTGQAEIAKTEKRIIVPRPPELFVPDEKCSLHEYDPLTDHKPPFPIYVRIGEPAFKWMVGDRYCFDCRERGGTLTPPVYWDEK